MGRHARKPVFGVSEKARLKPVFSATETSKKIEISLVASLAMVLSKKRIKKALISLRGRTGWSAPLLFANSRRQVEADSIQRHLRLSNCVDFCSPRHLQDFS